MKDTAQQQEPALLSADELRKLIYGAPSRCCGGWAGHRESCPLFDPTSLLARSMKALWEAKCL